MDAPIDELIKKMTLEEKAGFLSGLDFWNLKGLERLNIPSVMVTDGPHGLRKQAQGADHLGLNASVPATCFPSAAGLASTWDQDLIRRVGEALGEEAKTEEVAVLLGPGTNIKRSPLCGRNFEYFSEDPYLSSMMAASHIEGVQSKGIGTSLKHFAANNQEHRRMSVDARVDERTLREIYLASFEHAVKQAAPWTVMCSYNQVNGEYASESYRLLTEILRNEWGWDGVVVSDWGAVNERVDGLNAGMDLEMPGTNGIHDREIVEAVKKGDLTEATIDTAVGRVLGLIQKAVKNQQQTSYDKEAHHRLAREAAAEGMVLLKNEGRILPLDKKASVALIGSFVKQPRIQGGGSSHINPTRVDDVVEEVKKTTGTDRVTYAEGYPLENDAIDEARIEEACTTAAAADVAVLFAGLPDRYESEGYDRKHLELPENHRALIERVAAVQPNVIVVLSNGAPVEMPWLDEVPAVLEGYLGGQAFGGAVADLLFGDKTPSGKLAETFPVRLVDNPSYLNFPGEGDVVEYKEGLFVGYRHYDAKQIEPLFPFGHGLSYSTFEYSSLMIDSHDIDDTEEVEVSVDVMNTGSVEAKETVQLYVRDTESSVIRPEKELKGFAKVSLEPQEVKTISFTLDRRSFAYYNVELGDWQVETGDFDILIGKSSKDIVLKDTIHVRSTTVIPMAIHRNTLVGDLLKNPKTASVMQEFLAENNLFGGMETEEGEMDAMMDAMMANLPLRALVNFSMGAFTEKHLQELIGSLSRRI
ncbi:glycoside hydrolase family 3 C-terminal domain-containing protein [Halobacillus sp. KGW1]|uniref:glycoside hydrolase family 3 C-terminal domain-containing protein n=1 Tax=Halobacillus sp. KGW1 TaxID=1793726 RepID=UPI000780B6DD|nr:glycoside hydrolase family 3 C-terminal domain-containing protein [Halobacillus sp. KGW1]